MPSSLSRILAELMRKADRYSQYADILLPPFRALQSYRLKNLVESYQAFEKAANAFTQEFHNWESDWALEAHYVIAYETRILTERADRELLLMEKLLKS
ncbi:hypothetical protein H5410_046917 [Solanum commersonii]|uniref:Uncharacterized protein n=1 Tax=Solanum commersonii TaxID=4109 RepID=A0A9J5XDM1_SOLCO|nr:hypothetical protein H5410_046917 [Solanum commersonii]